MPIELSPIGPVVFVDTAGIDDVSALGGQRVEHTMKTLDRTELAILVLGEEGLGSLEIALLDAFEARKVPVLPVLAKADLARPSDSTLDRLQGRGLKPVIARTPRAATESTRCSRLWWISRRTSYLNSPTILVSDLVPSGGGWGVGRSDRSRSVQGTTEPAALPGDT